MCSAARCAKHHAYRLMNLRPNAIPQKYAIESLQMTKETGKRNQKRPLSTFAVNECTWEGGEWPRTEEA